MTDFCNPSLVSHLGDGQRHDLFCDTLEKLLEQPFLYMIISPKVNFSSLLLAHVTYLTLPLACFISSEIFINPVPLNLERLCHNICMQKRAF